MLDIQNLHVSVDGIPILKGLDFQAKEGEVHAIMGPNGSGKSTFAKVIAGHPEYKVTAGTVDYKKSNMKNIDMLGLAADERAKEGVFLAFQYPIEIPGVSNIDFLRTSFNSICRHQGVSEMNESEFRNFVSEKSKIVKFDSSFLDRAVNEGFSGGEKKKNEILQMAVLSPRLSFLDETDSGLDIDALRIVADGVNQLKNKQNAVIMVTHYQRLLDYIKPDYVHVLYKGRIVKTGGPELAKRLEEEGYDGIIAESEKVIQ